MLAERGKDLVHGRLDVEAEHVRARHHHRAHERVLQLEDLVDHLPLLALDDPLAGAHVHERPQLLLRQLGSLPPLVAGEAHGERGQAAEEQAHGRQRGPEPAHRPVDEGQEALGVLHRERHRQDLAEGREDQDGPEDLHDEPEPAAEHLVGDVGGERRGADVDQRDRHEQRDEQVVRAVDQLLGRRVAGLALRDTPEPRASEREVRRLRAREHRRAHDQRREDEQAGEDAVRHARVPSRSARSRVRRGPRVPRRP